jgi:hypothetical protein
MSLSRAHKATCSATAIGLAMAVLGLILLVAQAFSEVVADPTLSLEDAYWIGRLPWTAVGVDLTVIGATLALVPGALEAVLAGGLLRRVLSVVALAVGAFWWFLMTLPPPQAVPCLTCPPRGPEPLTMAYSPPQATTLYLLLPGAIAGVLALTPPIKRRNRMGSRTS